MHMTTKNNLQVKPRADRNPLVIMYEQGNQICQVRVEGFPGDDKKEQTLAAM